MSDASALGLPVDSDTGQLIVDWRTGRPQIAGQLAPPSIDALQRNQLGGILNWTPANIRQGFDNFLGGAARTFGGITGLDPYTDNPPISPSSARDPAAMDEAIEKALAFGPGAIGGAIKGFHGTRATFDRFLDQFMGTGEGAQYRGWGHYIAGAEGTARTYKPGPDPAAVFVGDTHIGDYAKSLGPEAGEEFYGAQLARPWLESAADRHHTAGIWAQGTDWIDNATKSLEQTIARWGGRQNLGPNENYAVQESQSALDWINNNRDKLRYGEKERGHLLEVNIKPDEHELLDLDKPINQQSDQVKDILKKNGWLDRYEPDKYPEDLDHITGDEFYEDHVRESEVAGSTPGGRHVGIGTAPIHHEAAKEGVSKDLHDIGIPGFKFLDQQSRRPTGPATYSGDMSDLQQQGLHILNELGRATRWESGEPQAYLDRLIENYTNTAAAAAKGYPYQHPGIEENLAALKSLDREKLVGPERSRNYVIFHPDNIEIKSRDGIPLTPVDHDPYAPTP